MGKKQEAKMSIKGELKPRFKNGKMLHTLPENSLYAPLPIPAYKLLAYKEEHFAVNVLMCLVSHLSFGQTVKPSVKTIVDLSGHGERSVRHGLNVLLAHGFIEKTTTRMGKIQHCEYTIMDLAYEMTPAFKQAIAQAKKEKVLRRIWSLQDQAAAKQLKANNSLLATEINQWPTDPFLG